MPINIHGKEYITVAERLKEIHAKEEKFSLTTEVLSHNPVVIKATLVCERGTFTGISAANPNKAIEKQSPYEVAETSSWGRALGAAGYGLVDDIATADEMAKAGVSPSKQPELDDLNLDDFEEKPKSNLTRFLEAHPNSNPRDTKGKVRCEVCGTPLTRNEEKFCKDKLEGRLLCYKDQKITKDESN